MTSTDEYLSVAEVAASLGVSAESIRRWIAAGQLVATKLGDSGPSPLRISRNELDRFIQVHRVVPR